MKVTELIEVVNRLCINHSDVKDKEKATYLSFLNLANRDLYKVAASGLDTISKTVNLFINPDNSTFTLPTDFFMTRIIFIGKMSIDKGLLKDKYNSDPLKAAYYVQGKSLFLNEGANKLTFFTGTDPSDNVIKKYIELTYSPKPLTLVENIVDPLSEIDEPVYPEDYHFYLAHGALFYFYLANRVFLEKRSDIKELWKENKQELAQYKNYGL